MPGKRKIGRPSKEEQLAKLQKQQAARERQLALQARRLATAQQAMEHQQQLRLLPPPMQRVEERVVRTPSPSLDGSKDGPSANEAAEALLGFSLFGLQR